MFSSNLGLLAFMAAGPWQILILLLVVLLLFGRRIPEMMGSLGKGVTEFKKGLHGADEEKNKVEKKDSEAEV